MDILQRNKWKVKGCASFFYCKNILSISDCPIWSLLRKCILFHWFSLLSTLKWHNFSTTKTIPFDSNPPEWLGVLMWTAKRGLFETRVDKFKYIGWVLDRKNRALWNAYVTMEMEILTRSTLAYNIHHHGNISVPTLSPRNIWYTRNWTCPSVSFWHLRMLFRSAPMRAVTMYLWCRMQTTISLEVRCHEHWEREKNNMRCNTSLIHLLYSFSKTFNICFALSSSYLALSLCCGDTSSLKQ